MDALFRFENVTKSFRSDFWRRPKVALQNVTMSFPEHACTGLLGHNGAGKTTTLRLLFGLARPDGGAITYRSEPLSVAARADLGYMPEIHKIAGALTCHEVLSLQLGRSRSKKTSSERIAGLLEELGLREFQKTRVKDLSKGLARRLAWAQAVIHDPGCLILDEPFSGLDPVSRDELIVRIRAQKKAGKTIVLCTHELESAQALCDEVNILRRGELAYTSLSDAGAATRRGGESRFYLRLSGVNATSVNATQRELGLPNPLHAQSMELLSELIFGDYADATRWLDAAVRQGFLVVAFGERDIGHPGNLLPYFR